MGAIGPFDEAWRAEDLIWFAASKVVQTAGHALASADDEGDFCWAVSGLEVGIQVAALLF